MSEDREPPEKLRILVHPYSVAANSSCPGYPKFGISPNCAYPGWCLEIIEALVRHIPHEFVVVDPNTESYDWGKLESNGSYSGLMGRIESGDVDMACLFFQKSELKQKHFDFSIPVAEIRPVFLIREVPITIWSILWNSLKPFEMWLWVLVLVALILQMCLWTGIGRMEERAGVRGARRTGQYFAWDVFEEMFHGGEHSFHFISGKLTRLVFSVFQVGMLRGLYTGLLLTALITPTDISPIKSRNDAIRLIKSARYKLISDRSAWFSEELSDSSEKLFVDLREATRNNPIVEPRSFEHALNLVDQGDYIYQSQSDSSAIEEAAKQCFVFMYSHDLSVRSAHFILTKGSPWTDVLNKEIMRNYPMIDRVYKRYFEDRQWNTPSCPRSPYATPGASDPLTFWSVFGIFVFFFAGLIVSFLSLVFEVVYHYIYSV